MELPIITVIIPVYNVEKYIDRCILSVINQTYKNLEIILVDDGSPDRCGKICDEYAKKDNRIKVIHKENGGLSDARNAGLDIASGDYIGFVDSDDYIHPDMYKLLYEAVSEYSADVAECKHRKIIGKKYKNPQPFKIKPDIQVFSGTEFAEKKVIGDYLNSIIVCNKLYKSERWKTLRFPQGKFTEDSYVAFDACYSADKIVVTDAELYFYLMRPGSISNSSGMKKAEDGVEGYNHMIERCNQSAASPEAKQKYMNVLTLCRQARILDAYYTAYELKNQESLKKYAILYREGKSLRKEHNFKGFNSKCFLYDISPKLFILGFKVRNFLYHV